MYLVMHTMIALLDYFVVNVNHGLYDVMYVTVALVRLWKVDRVPITHGI